MHVVHLYLVYISVIMLIGGVSMIKYKIDVLLSLKNAGFTTYKLRKDKLFGEATIQKLRNLELVSWDNINMVCSLLNCQPGDVLIYEKDSE